MTTNNPADAFRAALDNDEALAKKFAAATTEEELQALAQAAGLELPQAEEETVDLSDADLANVSGGYTFPQTDWIYCDNPWTNVYCTLKC